MQSLGPNFLAALRYDGLRLATLRALGEYQAKQMAMEELTGRYAVALDQHLADPFVLVPLAMLDFLCIYPFADGNGHMS